MSTFVYGKSPMDDQYYFRFVNRHREIILFSAEGYLTESECLVGIGSVKLNAIIDDRYKRFIGSDHRYYFKLIAENGDTLAKSEGFISEQTREREIENCQFDAARGGLIKVGELGRG